MQLEEVVMIQLNIQVCNIQQYIADIQYNEHDDAQNDIDLDMDIDLQEEDLDEMLLQ